MELPILKSHPLRNHPVITDALVVAAVVGACWASWAATGAGDQAGYGWGFALLVIVMGSVAWAIQISNRHSLQLQANKAKNSETDTSGALANRCQATTTNGTTGGTANNHRYLVPVGWLEKTYLGDETPGVLISGLGREEYTVVDAGLPMDSGRDGELLVVAVDHDTLVDIQALVVAKTGRNWPGWPEPA